MMKKYILCVLAVAAMGCAAAFAQTDGSKRPKKKQQTTTNASHHSKQTPSTPKQASKPTGKATKATYIPNVLTFNANGVHFQMVEVRAGSFRMGATAEQGSDAEQNEKPVHQVKLSAYYIGKTEVTQALWQAVMGSNPSKNKGSNLPVDNVSWTDCQTFIQKLNAITGEHFRLPTEAEWEFAARGGNNSRSYKYSGSNNADDVAWHKRNASDKSHPVASKAANELGIYDMSGNVWEWCADGKGAYSDATLTNPKGASSGTKHMPRGGCWGGYENSCRVSYRNDGEPSYRYHSLGLRLAR